jgi:hypothetical protein
MKKGVFELGDNPLECKVTIIKGDTYTKQMASLYIQNEWLIYMLAISEGKNGIP